MSKTPENIIDIVASFAADGLLARLEWMTVAPKAVLVLGEASEKLLTGLQKRFPDASFAECDKYDLVIVNLILPHHELPIMKTWRAKLAKGGLLLVTTLGPDTLKEWPDQTACTIKRIDMHDVGDALVETGLVDPVMEVEYYDLVYSDIKKMMFELMHGKLVNAEITSELFPSVDGKFHLTCELIYGHAWLGQEDNLRGENGETYVSIDMLRRQLGKH